MVKSRILNDSGALGIFLAFFIVVMAIGGFGVWGLMHRWSQAMALQLRLDRCVGEKAREMRILLRIAEASNFQMKALRVGEVAEFIFDGGAGSKAALTAELAVQEALLIKWNIARGAWVLRACGERGDGGPPLPAMSWNREPPDELGPQPFTWSNMDRLHFQAKNGPRVSAAELNQTRAGSGVKDVVLYGGPLLGKNWNAVWAEPR
jgi:hypothetical protein